MTRFINPHTGMLDPLTDWGALNADQVRFFLCVEVETRAPQGQGTIGRHKVHLRSRQDDDGEKRVAATSVGLKYMVELQGLTREMLNDFYVHAGMKDGSLKKIFGNSVDGTTYIFGVRDTVMESQDRAENRIQAISNFEKVFNIDEVDGQYEVTAKKDANDTDKDEIAETIQGLLNLSKVVLNDWGRDATQGHGRTAGTNDPTAVKRQGKADAQKRKKLTSLEELANTLSFPRDECENSDWILAENLKGIKTSTLRTRRSEGEKTTLENGSVLGRDPQDRVWWKPEEDSRKVFYYQKTLSQTDTCPAKKPRKK